LFFFFEIGVAAVLSNQKHDQCSNYRNRSYMHPELHRSSNYIKSNNPDTKKSQKVLKSFVPERMKWKNRFGLVQFYGRFDVGSSNIDTSMDTM